MAIETFSISLIAVKEIAPQVKHFTCKRTDGAPFNFIPGQFITLHIEHEGKVLRRSYSIASRADQSEWIEFAASYVKNGPASELLFNAKEGDQLQTSGPFGRLILRGDHPKRYVLIATGTGVTPYRAMLSQLDMLMRGHDLHAMVILGVQKRSGLLYGDEFAQFAATHPHFQFRAHYSRETLDNPKPYEFSGHVQHSFEQIELNPANDIVYLCGNPNMIDDAFELLKAKGFDNHNVRREKYISSN